MLTESRKTIGHLIHLFNDIRLYSAMLSYLINQIFVVFYVILNILLFYFYIKILNA